MASQPAHTHRSWLRLRPPRADQPPKVAGWSIADKYRRFRPGRCGRKDSLRKKSPPRAILSGNEDPPARRSGCEPPPPLESRWSGRGLQPRTFAQPAKQQTKKNNPTSKRLLLAVESDMLGPR